MMNDIQEVEVEMGNGETPSNVIPAREKTIVRVCCITPTRVVIQGERDSRPSKNSLIEACPTHTVSHSFSSNLNELIEEVIVRIFIHASLCRRIW